MKTEVPGFQNNCKFSNLFWNSESHCETSLLYCRYLLKILNKPSLFLYIHNCTGMEQRNVQQHLNIPLP